MRSRSAIRSPNDDLRFRPPPDLSALAFVSAGGCFSAAGLDEGLLSGFEEPANAEREAAEAIRSMEEDDDASNVNQSSSLSKKRPRSDNSATEEAAASAAAEPEVAMGASSGDAEDKGGRFAWEECPKVVALVEEDRWLLPPPIDLALFAVAFLRERARGRTCACGGLCGLACVCA